LYNREKALEERYEDQVIKVLLARFCKGRALRQQLLDYAEIRTRRRRLSLRLFRQLFPGFPMTLRAVPFAPECTKDALLKLFEGLDNLGLVECYEQARFETMPEDCDDPFGVVFDWPVANSGGGLVVHNQQIDLRVAGSQLLLTNRFGGSLVVEPLNVLLDTIENEIPGCRNWQPVFADVERVA